MPRLRLRALMAIAAVVLAAPWGPAGVLGAPASRPEAVLHEQWFDQVFGEAPTPPPPENRLVLVKEGHPGDTKVGRCAAGGPLRLGQQVYRRGIGVNSHSVLRVVLGQAANRHRPAPGIGHHRVPQARAVSRD